MTSKPMKTEEVTKMEWKERQIELADKIYPELMELSTILCERMSTLTINVNGGHFEYVPDRKEQSKEWKKEFNTFCFDELCDHLTVKGRSQMVEFIENLLTLSESRVRGEIDEIDIMLAMVQSTTDDTPHSEMIEMVGNIRKHLDSLTKKEGE